MAENLSLLLYIAQCGRATADHAAYRHLWYKGLTKWVSPTQMSLSDKGARLVNQQLYKKG